MKIRTVLIVALAIFTFSPAAIIFYIINASAIQNTKQHSFQQLQHVVESTSSTINNRIFDEDSIATLLSAHHLVVKHATCVQSEECITRVDDELVNVISNIDGLTNIRIYNRQAELTYYQLGFALSPEQMQLPELQSNFEFVWLDDLLYIHRVNIISQNNQQIGWLETYFEASWLVDAMKTVNVSGTYANFLLALKLNEQKLILTTEPSDNLHIDYQQLTNPLLKAAAEQSINGRQLSLEKNSFNQAEDFFVLTRGLAKPNWGLVLSMDNRQINRLTQDQLAQPLLIALSILIATILVGIFTALLIVRPVENLVQETKSEQVNELTKFATEVEEKGWFEIKRLAQNFNQIIANSSEISTELKKRIMERTIELNKAKLELKDLANRDALTGLYNAHYLDTRMSAELNRAKRNNAGIGIITFQIDGFDKIKNVPGNRQGDRVMKICANHVKNLLKPSDIVVRVNDDTFCIVLLKDAVLNTQDLVEKLKQELDTINYGTSEYSAHHSHSFGINIEDTAQGSFKKMFEKSVAALRYAKTQGGNMAINYFDLKK